MTTEEIKKDLKTIRGYYAERPVLESEFQIVPHKTTTLVQAYAEELNYCTEYIRMKNKKLLEYLRENITERRNAA